MVLTVEGSIVGQENESDVVGTGGTVVTGVNCQGIRSHGDAISLPVHFPVESAHANNDGSAAKSARKMISLKN